MTFQAYLDNIQTKTGVTADEFMKRAKEKGLLEPGTKVMAIVDWLKDEYELGHGHAMALVQYFKNNGYLKK